MSDHSSILSQSPAPGVALAKDVLPAQESLQNELKQPLHNTYIQCKLSIGSPDDPLENEADAMADTIMRMPEQNFIQRKCSHCEEEEKLHRKPLAPFIQRESTSFASPSDSLSNQINASRGSGSSMDSNTQTFMQSRFGTDFSDVKIHTGGESVQMNRELGAKAFTVGNDIYFNDGQYDPHAAEGKHLLAHELTHTIQQSESNIIQRKQFGFPIVFDSQPSCPPRAEIQASTSETQVASELYGDPGKPIDYTSEYMINVDYEQLLDEWKPFFDDCVSDERRVTSSKPKTTSESQQNFTPVETHEAGTGSTTNSSVPTIGIVARDQSPKLNLRESYSTNSKIIGTLDFNTRFQIIDQPDPTWYHISTSDGRVGYVAAQYIKTNLPEPTAFLHRVEGGTPGTAIAIAERYFHEEAGKWGMDLRFYINVIAYLNKIKIPDSYDGWKSVQLTAGNFIWIPGKEFARSLKGRVNSGSITYNIADALGVAEYIEGIVQKLADFGNAIRYSKKFFWESIKNHFEEAVINALVALAEMIVIAVAILAVTSAIGAAVGALFGGVGAAPGAAIGFEVGMTIIEWMGMIFLVKWILDATLKIGGLFVDFFAAVWKANGNLTKLEQAGYLFAEAIATLLGTLVEALVMIAAANGLGFVVGKLKGTKLGEKLGETKLAEWLKDRMDKKSTSKTEPEVVKEKPVEAATIAEGKSVDGKRKLEVDSEGVCRVCASPCLRIIEKYKAEILKLTNAFGRNMEAELLAIEANKKIPEPQKLKMYEYLEQELANIKDQGLTDIALSAKSKLIFDEMAKFRSELTLPAARSESGNPTISRLEIAGTHEYGVNYNKTSTPSRPKAEIDMMQTLVKEAYGTNATTAAMEHAEADAIISAFNKGLTAETASLYVDKPLCNFCYTSLRRLFPLLNLKALIVFEYVPSTGKVVSYTLFSAEL